MGDIRKILTIGVNLFILTGWLGSVSAGSISGVIRNSSGNEVSDVTVRCDRRNFPDNPLLATSDTNGGYSFLGVEGVCLITVMPEVNTGYAYGSRYVYVNLGENRTGVDFALEGGFHASLRLNSTSNYALSSINILVGNSHSRDGDFAVANVDPDGLCEMNLPQGTYSFFIKPGRYLGYPRIIAGAVSSSQSMRVYDVDSPDEEGTFIPIGINNPDNYAVTSELNIAAIPPGAYANCNIDNFGLYYNINSYGWGFPPGGGLTYGMWLPPGSFDSIFLVMDQRDDGIQSYTIRGVHETVTASPDHAEIFTYTSEGGSITGTVTYNGQPVFMALVFLVDTSGHLAGWAESGRDGVYALYNISEGNYTLQAKQPEWRLKSMGMLINVLDRQNATANVEFNSGTASVSGMVTDELGNPFQGVYVMYDITGSGDTFETYTDQDGNYLLQNLPAGIGYVTVKPETNSGYTWIDQHVYLTSEENKTGINFKLKQGFLVSGYLRNAAGGPVYREELQCSNGDGTRFFWGDTDPAGYYEIVLEPDTYRFYVAEDAHASLPLTKTISGPTRLEDILVYDFSNGNIFGGNISISSRPATVEFGIGAFGAGEMANINIDNFQLYNPIAYTELPFTGNANVPYGLLLPPPGNGYDVFFGVISDISGEPQSFTLRRGGFSSGSYDFSFDSEGGTVTGIVTYNGDPLLMATVLLTDSAGNFAGFAETDQNGRFTFYNVPTGIYSLQAKKYGAEKSKPVEAIASNSRVTNADISISPPIFNTIDDRIFKEGEAYSFNISAYDFDNDPLNFTRPLPQELPSGATFVNHGDGTGTFSWKPNYTQAGTYTIHFEVSDGNLNTPEDVSLTVNNVLVFGTIYEKLPAGNMPLEGATVSVLNIARTTTFLSATTDAQGKFTIIGVIPDANYIIKTEKDSYSTYSGITILKNSQALPFSVALYPPQFAGVPAGATVNADEMYVLNISAADQNLGDKLIFSSPNLPQGAQLADNGNRTASFSWTPDGSQVGSHIINFQVTDKLFTANADLAIEVKSVNNPPALNPIPDSSVYEGTLLQFKLIASDPDPGNILTFSTDNLPQGANLNNATGDFGWTPDFQQKGSYSITFKVNDGKGGEDSKQSGITVINSSLYGLVINKFTKQPISDADIFILKGAKLIAKTKTDTSGSYVIAENLPAGLYIVRVSAGGYIPAVRISRLVYDNTIRTDIGLINKKAALRQGGLRWQ